MLDVADFYGAKDIEFDQVRDMQYLFITFRFQSLPNVSFPPQNISNILFNELSLQHRM